MAQRRLHFGSEAVMVSGYGPDYENARPQAMTRMVKTRSGI
jgi:hypothetical protein